MSLDNAKNFAKVTVSTGYNSTDTSIVLTTGHGAKLPTAPFNAVWYNSTDYPDPSDDPNVEIVRVTAISTDTLTVTRAQESTSASTKNTSGKTYKMIAGLTAKSLNTDLIPGDLVVFATPGIGQLGGAGSPTISSRGTSFYTPSVRFADAITGWWRMSVKVPQGATSISSIKLIMSAAATGNAALKFRTARVTFGSTAVNQEDTTDTLAAYAVAGTIGQINTVSVPAGAYNGLTSIVAGNLIALEIERQAADVLDTINDVLDIHGVEFTFA